MADPLYSIILPTYNEKENLPILMELFEKHLKNIKYEVIIVDDNSPDGTLKIAKIIKKLFGKDKIKILSRPGKLGLGTAYIDGFKISSGDYIILMDCDFSHHVLFLKQEKSQCDIVLGTRYQLGEKDGQLSGVSGWSFKRKIISAGANTLTQIILNPNVSDLTSSFRMYKRESFSRLIKHITSTGFSFQMEIIIIARILDLTIEEVPIIFVDRLYGESKLSSTEFTSFLKSLIILFAKKYFLPLKNILY